MRYLLIILFPFKTFSQDTAIWRVGNEAVVTQYQVQKSKDTSSWTTIANVDKGKKSYYYILPKETNYYRIKASGVQTYVTEPILLTVGTNASNITSATIKSYSTSDYLSWAVLKEVNIVYYLIERSVNSAAYTQVTRITARGFTKYGVYVTKIGTTRKYRLTPVFKDGTKGATKYFN